MGALRQIAATSYRVSFSLRCGWSQSFHLVALEQLVEASLQAEPPDYWEKTPLLFVWGSFASF